MANTYVDYTGNGSTQTFAFTFDYLESTHIKVEVNSVETTAFTVDASAKTVTLTTAPAAGSVLRIRRDSNSSVALMDFSDGSVLVENDLDRAYLHNLYLNEELDELNNLSLQKVVGGDDWDAKGHKITNLGTIDDTDAANVATPKGYVDDSISRAVTGVKSGPLKYVVSGANGANGTDTTFSFGSDISVGMDTVYDVNIDGVFQEPKAGTSEGAFSVNANDNTITFDSPPPSGSQVVVVVRGYAQEVTAGSVTTNTIAEGAITNTKIANNAIETTNINNLAVTNGKIADATITTGKLAAIDAGKLIVGQTGSSPSAQAVSGDATLAATGALTISNNAVTTGKMANMAQGVLGNTTANSSSVAVVPFGVVADSSTNICTAQQIKTYVDAQVESKDALSELSGDLDDISTGTTNKHFTSTEKTKLAGIETGADVTDTTNVVASLTAGNNITIANNGTITASGVDDNSITAAKISDTDGQFLVDDGTTKKVVVNNNAADVDFTVKGNSGNLIQTDASTSQVGINGAPSTIATDYYDLTVHGETLIKQPSGDNNAQLTVENTQTSGTNLSAILVVQAKESAVIRLHDNDASSGVDTYDIASENGELKFATLDDSTNPATGFELFRVTKQSLGGTNKTIMNMSGLPDATQLSSLQTGDLYQDNGTVKIKT